MWRGVSIETRGDSGEMVMDVEEGILDRTVQDMAREPRARFLLKQYGSFRRLMWAYWKGELSPKDEAELESTFRPEDRIGYRPVEGECRP